MQLLTRLASIEKGLDAINAEADNAAEKNQENVFKLEHARKVCLGLTTSREMVKVGIRGQYVRARGARFRFTPLHRSPHAKASRLHSLFRSKPIFPLMLTRLTSSIIVFPVKADASRLTAIRRL